MCLRNPIYLLVVLSTLAAFAGCDAKKSGTAATGAAANPATEPGAVPSDAEAKAFATTFEQAVATGVGVDINALIDWDVLLNTVTSNVDVDKRFRAGFLKSAKENTSAEGSFAQQLAQVAKNGGALTLIRVHEVKGEKRALFRLTLPDGGLNYNDLVLAKTKAGDVHVVDNYMFLASEKMTETLRRVYLMAAAGNSGSLIDKLRGVESDFIKHADKFTSMGENLRRGNYQAVISLYGQLPNSLQKEKAVMIMRLQAAMNIDEATYAEALDDFRTVHAGDPSLDLVSIDYHVLRKDYAESLACIDGLDKVVKDPFLNTMRTNVHVLTGDLAAARQAAEKSVAELPEFAASHTAMLNVVLAEKDFDATVDLLIKLRRDFDMQFNDLRTVPEYAEFVKSPAYQRWVQSRGF